MEILWTVTLVDNTWGQAEECFFLRSCSWDAITFIVVTLYMYVKELVPGDLEHSLTVVFVDWLIEFKTRTMNWIYQGVDTGMSQACDFSLFLILTDLMFIPFSEGLLVMSSILDSLGEWVCELQCLWFESYAISESFFLWCLLYNYSRFLPVIFFWKIWFFYYTILSNVFCIRDYLRKDPIKVHWSYVSSLQA